jgi:uncharacterized protein involved in outer membrane biogenesis
VSETASSLRSYWRSVVGGARAAPPRISQWARDSWTGFRTRRRARADAVAAGQAPRHKHRTLAVVGGVLVTLVVAIVAFLYWFNWDRARGPIARFASARLYRTVSIDGHLKVHLLTWTPTVTVGGLRISQPAWAGKGDMIAINSVTASIRLTPLFHGQVILPLIDLEQPRFDILRNAQGQANWHFGSGKPSNGKAFKLPPIQQFIINDGRLRYSDAKLKLLVNSAIEAREKRSGPYAEGFHMDGKGTINGNPFLLKATGGPMINIDPGRPYPFKADVTGGQTRILADGAITKPFDFGNISTNLTVSGPDLNQLYMLTRLAMPNTPPYKLSGHLVRDQSEYRFTGINGRVGSSDLNGTLTVETKGRLTLTANLNSRILELADLMTVLGGAPSTKGPISAEQMAVAKTMKANRRLLPDATLQIDRLRSMDATLKYRATAVRSTTLPVRAAALDLKLDHGLLQLDPFKFQLVSGQVIGKASINGRTSTPVTDFDARLTGVSIQQFIKVSGPPPIEGLIQARARLHGTGDSVHKAAANSNGAITIVVPHGQIRQAFAELLGINAFKGLYMLLNKDNKQTDLRCAVANFKVSNGVAMADTVVVDTGVVKATGSGTINLGSEQLNLKIDGKTKQPRLVHLWAPITVTGPLAAPKPGVQLQNVAAQAGVAVALGAVLSPLAAILPFVDPGLGKDADCAGLVAEASSTGAPVKATFRPPPAEAAKAAAKSQAKITAAAR